MSTTAEHLSLQRRHVPRAHPWLWAPVNSSLSLLIDICIFPAKFNPANLIQVMQLFFFFFISPKQAPRHISALEILSPSF